LQGRAERAGELAACLDVADKFPMAVTKTVQTPAAAGIAGTSTTTKPGACSLQAHGGKYEIRFDWHLV